MENNYRPENNGYGDQPRQDPFGAPQNMPRPSAPTNPSAPSGAPRQPAGGSYYSPRSGYASDSGSVAGGGYVPPAGGYASHAAPDSDPSRISPPGGNEPPKKKKSHMGLKALGVFAGIAFLSYASIKCYQFATSNASVRQFLGKDSSSESDSLEESSMTTAVSESSAADEASSDTETKPTGQDLSWIDLAKRENAMSIPDIVDKVTPATVGVASSFLYQGQTYSFFGFGQPQSVEQEVSATGTGIIMSDNGDGSYYIVTNAHVIYDTSQKYHMGRATDVKIALNPDYYDNGDKQLSATIVGYDTSEDIAVLKVNTNEKLTVAEFGDSDELRVGELVVAIGNPLGFDLFGSVSTGIVSALNREVTINESTMRLIQTDTAINSGNSGGPLINSCGQVIGINSSKISSNYSDDSASVEGLCFAIPITHAKAIIDQLINCGYVTGKPMIGIMGKDVSEEMSQAYGLPVGVYVRQVTEGGAADLAGIQIGDVIIAINGETISNYDELNKVKDQYKAGDEITVTVTRAGVDLDFKLILQEKKAE